MLMKKNAFIVSLSLFLAAAGVSFAAAPAPSQRIEAKLALESSLEKRLLAVLQKALGTDDVIVIVKADLYTREELEEEIMPGVPVKDTPSGEAATVSETMIRSINAIVIVDEATSQKDLELIERTAKSIVGLKAKRGDRITIEKLKMQRNDKTPAGPEAQTAASKSRTEKEKGFFEELLRPQVLISLFWLLSVVGGMLLLYASFIRPMLKLAADALSAWATAQESKAATADNPRPALAQTPVLSNGHHNGNGNGNGNGRKSAEREKMPFGFVSDKNIPMLAHMMKRMTPRTCAVITHYLPAQLAAQIIVGLKPEKRKDVVRQMSRVTQLQEAEVRAIEANVKRKIDFLMGGEEKLASILEEVPAGLQEEMLSTLTDRDPDLGRRLSRRIVTLDDIGSLSGDDIKRLAEHVQLKSIAAVLRGSEDLQHRLIPRLTEGMGQWLSQEIELAQNLPPSVLASEQRTVLSALSSLVHSGSIIIAREDSGFADLNDGLYPEESAAAEETEEDEGPSFESEMQPIESSPAPEIPEGFIAPAVQSPKPTVAKPVEEYPEHSSPTENLGLTPVDPAADLLPNADAADLPPAPPAVPSAEADIKPERRPKRRSPQPPENL
jgi:hypothetical protein